MKIIICLFSFQLLWAFKVEAKNKLSFLHLNIQNLTTEEINNQSPKIKNFILLQKKYSPDIISLNEVQYDRKGVPTSKFKTKGENLNKINKHLFPKYIDSFFSYSLTGRNAKKNVFGNYSMIKNPQLADQTNFGNFPGQYSLGSLSRYKFASKRIYNVKIKDFFPSISIKSYKRQNGTSYPENLMLFDKNFNHTQIAINKKTINIIFAHLTPDFNFGSKLLINQLRNHLQLKFLRWFINSDGLSKAKNGLPPLPPGSSYIIIGDLNTDPFSKTKSAKEMSSLLKETKSAITISKKNATFPSKKLILDYALMSKDLIVSNAKVIQSEISDHLPIYFEVLLKD